MQTGEALKASSFPAIVCHGLAHLIPPVRAGELAISALAECILSSDKQKFRILDEENCAGSSVLRRVFSALIFHLVGG
jgi:hypothetical protein